LCAVALAGETRVPAKAESKTGLVEAEAYRTIALYNAESFGQISFDVGETLYVLDKLEYGKQ